MIKNGIEVIPVTGRHLGGIPKEILSLDINYAICANGASLYDVKKKMLIKAEFIEKKILLEIVSLCEKYEIMSEFDGKISKIIRNLLPVEKTCIVCYTIQAQINLE